MSASATSSKATKSWKKNASCKGLHPLRRMRKPIDKAQVSVEPNTCAFFVPYPFPALCAGIFLAALHAAYSAASENTQPQSGPGGLAIPVVRIADACSDAQYNKPTPTQRTQQPTTPIPFREQHTAPPERFRKHAATIRTGRPRYSRSQNSGRMQRCTIQQTYTNATDATTDYPHPLSRATYRTSRTPPKTRSNNPNWAASLFPQSE